MQELAFGISKGAMFSVFPTFGGPTNMVFTLVPVIGFLLFVVVIGLFIVFAIRGAAQWKRNNESPVLTVDATLVAKRTDVSRSGHHNMGDNNMHHTHTSTTYYATFQVSSGDRLEFCIPDTEYGMLAEGDTGKLTFQGTRYKGFQRMRF